MIDTDETRQRKCEEKIRLYTQLGISSTPSNLYFDTNYQKIQKYFEILSNQNTDLNDETSLTYSEFLKEAKGIVNEATNKLIDWSLTIADNNKHISDSMVDLIIPTVFFETGNAKNPASDTKLMFWKREIASKYDTLVQRGNDLWDGGIYLAKGSQITPALKRIGMKWHSEKTNDINYVTNYLNDLGFKNYAQISEFALAMLRFVDKGKVRTFYFDSASGKTDQLFIKVALVIQEKLGEEEFRKINDRLTEDEITKFFE